MKKSYLRMAGILLGAMLVLNACDDNFEQPQVTAPTGVATVANGAAEQSVTFTVAVDPSLSATYSATGTGVAVSNGTGDVDGTSVVVNFDAGTAAGAASILLTVTDSEGQTDDATAILNIEAKENVVIVTDNISDEATWTSDKVWVLAGRITVLDGAILNIEAGTIIKGQAGTGPNATALLVARGGKLMAEGTASAPIIFTSVADELEPSHIAAGDFGSPNLDPDLDGLWGGVIVLGKAPISADADAIQIEGIPPSDQNGLYGGDFPDDNSGVIQYISIRHGGSNIGEGNEINGLTLGGVGTGTLIEYVEVVANQDDGIEWFGGTVNVTNALVWNSGDDALDTDQAWAGTMDNFILICGPTTDHALEIDGPEGSMLDRHIVKNGSVKGHPASELGDFRDGARGTFENIYFFGFDSPATTDGRGDFSLSGDKTTTNFANGDLIFNNLEVTLPADTDLTDVFKHGTDAHATAVAAGANTVGGDKSKFSGWTWASIAGELDDF